MMRYELINPERAFPLDKYEFQKLARYNEEVAHGILHTEEYARLMKLLQGRWDKFERRDTD